MKHYVPATPTQWVVLSLVAVNILRVWTAVTWHDVLMEFSVTIPPALSGVVGAIWAVILLILYWGMALEKAWAGKMLFGSVAGYIVWYWSERIVLLNPKPNVLFAVILNLVIVSIIFFENKISSREAYERNIENSDIE